MAPPLPSSPAYSTPHPSLLWLKPDLALKKLIAAIDQRIYGERVGRTQGQSECRPEKMSDGVDSQTSSKTTPNREFPTKKNEPDEAWSIDQSMHCQKRT